MSPRVASFCAAATGAAAARSAQIPSCSPRTIRAASSSGSVTRTTRPSDSVTACSDCTVPVIPASGLALVLVSRLGVDPILAPGQRARHRAANLDGDHPRVGVHHPPVGQLAESAPDACDAVAQAGGHGHQVGDGEAQLLDDLLGDGACNPRSPPGRRRSAARRGSRSPASRASARPPPAATSGTRARHAHRPAAHALDGVDRRPPVLGDGSVQQADRPHPGAGRIGRGGHAQ